MNARKGRRMVARPWARLLLGDTAVLVVVLIIVVVAVAAGSSYLAHDLGAADLVGVIIGVPLILLGTRSPLRALALSVAATVVTIGITGDRALLLAAVVFLLYRVASRENRRTTLYAGGAAVAAIYAASILFIDNVSVDRDLDVAAWSILAIAVGDAVRSRRRYLREVEERAQRAEQSREEEARRRVVEERLRIARELHDLVAHRMVVINVQAGVADHMLRRKPEEAEHALQIVRESVSQVLGELGEILSVLRNIDDPEAPVEPVPTLGELGTLVASFASAGLDVTWTSSGSLEGVADSVQLVLYRLAQEGLTNAKRHGDGHAVLVVARTPSAVDVTITNRVSTNGGLAPGSGYGLLGMRERVAAVGGTIEIGPTADGSFKVAAHIPVTGRKPA